MFWWWEYKHTQGVHNRRRVCESSRVDRIVAVSSPHEEVDSACTGAVVGPVRGLKPQQKAF